MTAKEFLSQAFLLNRQIRLDTLRLEAMRSALYGRSAGFGSDGSGRSLSGDNRTENAIAKTLDFEDRLNAEIDKLVDKKLEIDRAISAVPDAVQREVLTRRYLLFQKWERIAEEMQMDLRWIFRIHSKALNQLTIESH